MQIGKEIVSFTVNLQIISELRRGDSPKVGDSIIFALISSGEGSTLQTKHFAARSTGRLKSNSAKERVYRERCNHSAAFFLLQGFGT